MSDSSLLVEFATWIDKNKEWVFSGVGVIVVPALINKLLKQKNNKVIDDTKTNQPVINVNVKNNNHSNAETITKIT